VEADRGSYASGEEGKEMSTLQRDRISIGIQRAKQVNLAILRCLFMPLMSFLQRHLGIIEN